jgi:DNA-binding NarL/FixJ family response regulator
MNTLKVRILIGTSEKDILRSARAMIRYHFRERGGTVVGSATGRDNLVRRAATGKLDLIVMFGQTLLPGSDRADLPLENSVRAIQEVKAKVSTPILALSTIPESSRRLVTAGADVFLAMPYKLKDFTDAVDRCLKRR